MKKINLLLCLIISSITLYAQDTISDVKWNFGVNTSTGGCFLLPLDEDDGIKKFMLVHGGQFLGEFKYKKFSIGTGVSVAQRGYRLDLTGIGNDEYEADVSFYNLGLPLLMKYYPVQGKKANFFLSLNTVFDFTLYYKIEERYKEDGYTEYYGERGWNQNDFDYFNPTVGLSLGTEISMKNFFMRIEPYASFMPTKKLFDGKYAITSGLRLGFFMGKSKLGCKKKSKK